MAYSQWHHRLLTALVVALLSGCSWVEISSEGETVRLLSVNEVADCQRFGAVNASVLDKVGFLNRSEEKQREELTTLARNQAAKMEADGVFPIGEIKEGAQQFGVYRCE